MHDDGMPHYGAEIKPKKKTWRRRPSPYSDRWADTRTIPVDTFLLHGLLGHRPERVMIVLALVWLSWKRQLPIPDSIDGWTTKQIQGCFGRIAHTNRLRRWYTPDVVEDVRALLANRRAPLFDGGREWVFDKSNGVCHHCGCELDINDFHVDHLLPIAQGGFSHNDNLVASCPPCNWRKGGR